MSTFASLFWVSALLLDGECKTIETTIMGDSMQGILFDGQKVTVYTPACGAFERYDHMLFTHEETPNAVVKQLWGLPGDIIEVNRNGSFTINGVKALTPFKRDYRLVGAARTRFKKLEGKPIDGYILLGHSGIEMGSTGSLDSGRFGLIPKENIIGFIKREEPYKPQ
ncbi:MAG: S26 family signal peptidase [Kordiimonas sp.]